MDEKKQIETMDKRLEKFRVLEDEMSEIEEALRIKHNAERNSRIKKMVSEESKENLARRLTKKKIEYEALKGEANGQA